MMLQKPLADSWLTIWREYAAIIRSDMSPDAGSPVLGDISLYMNPTSLQIFSILLQNCGL